MNDQNTTQQSSSQAVQGETHQKVIGVEGRRNTMFEAAAAAKILRNFMPAGELEAVGDACRGEEAQFFKDKMVQMANLIITMPKTYETDGQGMDAIAHLHYFSGGFDWYITERDMETEQHQAFGLACMHERELGYISIDDLIHNGVELDLHWTPKPLKDC